jgi:hypothetical protein
MIAEILNIICLVILIMFFNMYIYRKTNGQTVVLENWLDFDMDKLNNAYSIFKRGKNVLINKINNDNLNIHNNRIRYKDDLVKANDAELQKAISERDLIVKQLEKNHESYQNNIEIINDKINTSLFQDKKQ